MGKPLRHHMKNIINYNPSTFLNLWIPTLKIIKNILDEDSIENNPPPKSLSSRKMTCDIRELTVEHLRNVIMVLSSFGILKGSPDEYVDGSISDQTWSLIEDMEYCNQFLEECKSAAANPVSEYLVMTGE